MLFYWQERLISKDQKISENFFVRGDGTVSGKSKNNNLKKNTQLYYL